jgi:hypothetical protein
MIRAGFGSGERPMRRLSIFCAVAALAATALLFAEQDSAQAYCRGCVVEPKIAEATLDLSQVRAEAPPYEINAVCHVEKQKRLIKGRWRWWPMTICE